MNEAQIQEIINKAWDYVYLHGPRILFALIFLVIGLWLIRISGNLLKKFLKKRDFDSALESFLLSFAKIALRVLLVISVISMMGFETTSFVAVLGAAGLAIGLSLQGSLSNFAGGVLILVFKPFKVGDTIEAQNVNGVVREVGIIYTSVTTSQNQKVTIPNGILSNGTIINYSTEPNRRLDMAFSISYADDLRKAKEIIQKIIDEQPEILPSPAPVIGVTNLGPTGVELSVQVWLARENHQNTGFQLREKIKLAFEAAGFTPANIQQVILAQNIDAKNS